MAPPVSPTATGNGRVIRKHITEWYLLGMLVVQFIDLTLHFDGSSQGDPSGVMRFG